MKDTSAKLNDQSAAVNKLNKALEGAKQELELQTEVVEKLSKTLETARTSNDETEKKLQARIVELSDAQKALKQAEADKNAAVDKMKQELEAAR